MLTSWRKKGKCQLFAYKNLNMNERGLWTIPLEEETQQEEQMSSFPSSSGFGKECLSVSNRLWRPGSAAASFCITPLNFPADWIGGLVPEHRAFWMAVPLRRKNYYVQMVEPFILGRKYNTFFAVTVIGSENTLLAILAMDQGNLTAIYMKFTEWCDHWDK